MSEKATFVPEGVATYRTKSGRVMVEPVKTGRTLQPSRVREAVLKVLQARGEDDQAKRG